MRVRVYPSDVSSSVKIPPSKSIAHRTLICAALAFGTSRILNISLSKDILATIDVLRKLGAKIDIDEDCCVVTGIGGMESENIEAYCNESGSTLRFFIPIVSVLCQNATLTGSKRLLERPQSVYEAIFKSQGITFFNDGKKINLSGKLTSGEYVVKGDISSQFITGLLFALPMLKGDSLIKVLPPFESRSYVQLTIDTLKDFGVEVLFKDDNTLFIKGNQQYKPYDTSVEGDYSQLAFYAVLAAIKGDIRCEGIKENSHQGDKKILDIIKSFGADYCFDNNSVVIKKGDLKAQDIDLSDCPDLGPILTVLLSFSKGSGTIFNAERLRIKESDRIEDVKKELLALLVNISSTKDSIKIDGRQPRTDEIEVYAHNDHRIAMSLSVFAACSEIPVVIEGAQCVDKSYPDFFKDILSVGVKVEILDE